VPTSKSLHYDSIGGAVEALPPVPGNRAGLDLGTTLERIQQNFVISDPSLPDSPIVFASDDFLELTGYSREEVLGRNCRFLQGPQTDPRAVKEIRDAIATASECTVRILNYRKDGSPFWNMFSIAPVFDTNRAVRFFVGIQGDVTEEQDAGKAKRAATQQTKLLQSAISTHKRPAEVFSSVDGSKMLCPKPHMSTDRAVAWEALRKVFERDGKISANNFSAVKNLGQGDVGTVRLVEMKGTTGGKGKNGRCVFAVKTLNKIEMIERNKVGRVKTEEEILDALDHPFLPTMFAKFQTNHHVNFLLEYCGGGELYQLLLKQPGARFTEETSRFYAAEVLLALQYLHLLGFIYRDLKPENVLLHDDGHVMLSDFDLSYVAETRLKLVPRSSMPHVAAFQSSDRRMQTSREGSPSKAESSPQHGKAHVKRPTNGFTEFSSTSAPIDTPSRKQPVLSADEDMLVVAEPEAAANSFVGTEEYLSPEVINATGHNGSVDWWSFGIFLYEMVAGSTPFKGAKREDTFKKVVHNILTFPTSPQFSPELKDLLTRLLEKNPEKRLGSAGGADEIKRHPFFQSINFPLIRNCKAPFHSADSQKPSPPARHVSGASKSPGPKTPTVPEETAEMFVMDS